MFVIYSNNLFNFFSEQFFSLFSKFLTIFNIVKNDMKKVLVRSLFFMIMELALLIFAIKKKREFNYEIYYEKKKLVKCIKFSISSKCTFLAPNKNNHQHFIIKGMIYNTFDVCEREKIPMRFHQIGQYIILPTKFPSVKNCIFEYTDPNTQFGTPDKPISTYEFKKEFIFK